MLALDPRRTRGRGEGYNLCLEKIGVLKCKMIGKDIRGIYKGYYMAVRRYEISLRVLKNYPTHSLRSLVKYFST